MMYKHVNELYKRKILNKISSNKYIIIIRLPLLSIVIIIIQLIFYKILQNSREIGQILRDGKAKEKKTIFYKNQGFDKFFQSKI